ncbi:MAG: lipoate--protein ligase [Nitrososphaerota archaeon]
MVKWRLLDLGFADHLMAQTFYEATAKALDEGLVTNTLILVIPKNPYVCIGFHQELEKEVDVEYCKQAGLPIIRRTQGGGAVYLDSNQLFYQVVARKDDELVPSNVERLFEKFLGVTVYVYRKLGLPAEFKPINDVVVRGKKISGNGAGVFGNNAVILVGNIILDLDYESMCRILRVPDEKFKDKMARSMREWVTSLKNELGYVPELEEIKRLIIEGYRELLGIELEEAGPSKEELEIWENEVKPRHLSAEWLYMPEGRHGWLADGRVVKVSSSVKLVEVAYKASKLIRITAEVVDGKLSDVLISGDFFMIPESNVVKLEEVLKGSPLEMNEILKRIESFYQETGTQTPGITAEDFAKGILKIKEAIEGV